MARSVKVLMTSVAAEVEEPRLEKRGCKYYPNPGYFSRTER